VQLAKEKNFSNEELKDSTELACRLIANLPGDGVRLEELQVFLVVFLQLVHQRFRPLYLLGKLQLFCEPLPNARGDRFLRGPVGGRDEYLLLFPSSFPDESLLFSHFQCRGTAA
jgi:hypothetical protein